MLKKRQFIESSFGQMQLQRIAEAHKAGLEESPRRSDGWQDGWQPFGTWLLLPPVHQDPCYEFLK